MALDKPNGPIEIALISAEVTPYARVGGLGDMIGSLGSALKRSQASPFFILPLYRSIDREFLVKVRMMSIPIGTQIFIVEIWRNNHTEQIPIYLIDIPELFDRDGIYGENGEDYTDNALRFIAFSRAALELLKTLSLSPSIVHAHDWHTALIPFYLKTLYHQDPFFKKCRSILTIHNAGYQGIFPESEFSNTNLNPIYFSDRYLEFEGKLNFLKSGIISADALTAVSPTYAKEIQVVPAGFGLEYFFKNRRRDLHGILNGIDTEEWNPEADSYLPKNYSSENSTAKSICKKNLQEELGLPISDNKPLIAVISRLAYQKGIDLILKLLSEWPNDDVQWVFLGTGDLDLEQGLQEIAQRFPKNISAQIRFDQALSHRIEAGADFFLMPSRYEPCGTNQMYSLRYGTIPIVHATGGLKDTVIDIKEHSHKGTGIIFNSLDLETLQKAILKALEIFRNKTLLNKIRNHGMIQDFSWDRSAKAYLKVYQDALARPVYKLK